MKVAIIGSNSFSGLGFARQLLTNGHSVVGISRSPRASYPFNLIDPASSDFQFFQLDLALEAEKIADLIQSMGIKKVVNFAAQSMVAQSWERPQDWYRTNVESLAILANRLITNGADLDRFIQFTTPEVYGSTSGWINESNVFAPSTPYAISRAASDWHLMALERRGLLPVIFTRAANVYGEGQQLYRIVPKTILSGMCRRRISLHGGGKSRRSFIHIEDVSNALSLILSQGKSGESYHISTQESISIGDLVHKIFGFIGGDYESLVEDAPETPGKDEFYLLRSEKIRSDLNWSDQISIEQGIRRTIDWVKSNLEILSKLPTEYFHRRSS